MWRQSTKNEYVDPFGMELAPIKTSPYRNNMFKACLYSLIKFWVVLVKSKFN